MTRLSSQIIKVFFVIFYLLEEEELALNEKVEAPIPESTLQSSQKRDKPDSQLDAKQKKKEKFAELKVSFACCFSLETTKGTECKKQNNIWYSSNVTSWASCLFLVLYNSWKWR